MMKEQKSATNMSRVPATRHKTIEAEAGTRERLLSAARDLLARDGVAVRVADIVEQAGANIGAINYHFGSKDKLLQVVLEAACTQVVTERLRLLAIATEGGRSASICDIITAWITPALEQISGRVDEGRFVGQLTKIVLDVRNDDHIGAPSAIKLQACNATFVEALARARPDLTRTSLEWRMSGMIGTLVYASETYSIRSGFAPADRAPDLEEAKTELLAFLIAGFEAPSP